MEGESQLEARYNELRDQLDELIGEEYLHPLAFNRLQRRLQELQKGNADYARLMYQIDEVGAKIPEDRRHAIVAEREKRDWQRPVLKSAEEAEK